MNKCSSCGIEVESEFYKRGWGFSQFDTCIPCSNCFPMEEIFLDISYGMSRYKESLMNGRVPSWDSRDGERTPVIMKNGCTVMRNGQYVLIKEVLDEFRDRIRAIAGIDGYKSRLMYEFCKEHGFYIRNIEFPHMKKEDKIVQKNGTYVLNAVLSNEGYPDSKWKFVSGTLYDADGTVLGHKEPIEPGTTKTQ